MKIILLNLDIDKSRKMWYN